MRTGNLDGVLNAGLFQVIYDSGELSSTQTTLTISNLDGDNDFEYELIVRIVNSYNGTNECKCRFNNDGTTNYAFQYLDAGNTSISAASNNNTGFGNIAYAEALNQLSFTRTIIKAKSGVERLAMTQYVEAVATTTVTYTGLVGQRWNNTADNITSLSIVSDHTGGIGIGSRVILVKRNANTTGMKTGSLNIRGHVKGAWERIYSYTTTGATTTLTVSGLTGNTDILYKILIRFNEGDTDASCSIRPNNDSGANYGYQFMRSDAVPEAARATGTTNFWGAYASSVKPLSTSETLFFAKSGYVRTAMQTHMQNVGDTTFYYSYEVGFAWNDTTNQVTSLVFYGDTGDIGTGTVIEVYRLNL